MYSGTNPYEAIATAHAYLDFISQYPNVRFMLTTHYIRLCKFFKTHQRIANYNMEATINNNNNAKYTYKIIKGISKIKGAIMVLKQLNYPIQILKNADDIIKRI